MTDQITAKVIKWIKEGKDPRSAHWQGGLESILKLFEPYLDPGRLVPVKALDESAFSIFKAAAAATDLSPDLQAAFTPPDLANQVTPPESAGELFRIDKDKPSYKLLIARPGQEMRILCAEISEQAEKPGMDIFQSGALLGSYNFETSVECLENLPKIIKAHFWKRDKWQKDDYIRYTVFWFEKVVDLGQKDIHVEPDFSFFHSPTLIRSNSNDVIFVLIFEYLKHQFSDAAGPYANQVSDIFAIPNDADRMAHIQNFVDYTVYHLLSVMRDANLVRFDELTARQRKQFNRESAATIDKLVRRIPQLSLFKK